MSIVVSATTRTLGSGRGKRAAFINRAAILLRDATQCYRAGDFADAIELAYQAALRTAGAYLCDTPILKERRKPTGAWNQLALAGVDGRAWAESFVPYSRIRSRLINGLDSSVDGAVVADLIELAQQFLDEVEGESVELVA